jgi:hypothetical protein
MAKIRELKDLASESEEFSEEDFSEEDNSEEEEDTQGKKKGNAAAAASAPAAGSAACSPLQILVLVLIAIVVRLRAFDRVPSSSRNLIWIAPFSRHAPFCAAFVVCTTSPPGAQVIGGFFVGTDDATASAPWFNAARVWNLSKYQVKICYFYCRRQGMHARDLVIYWYKGWILGAIGQGKLKWNVGIKEKSGQESKKGASESTRVYACELGSFKMWRVAVAGGAATPACVSGGSGCARFSNWLEAERPICREETDGEIRGRRTPALSDDKSCCVLLDDKSEAPLCTCMWFEEIKAKKMPLKWLLDEKKIVQHERSNIVAPIPAAAHSKWLAVSLFETAGNAPQAVHAARNTEQGTN